MRLVLCLDNSEHLFFLNSAFTRVAVSVADVSGSEGFMCDGSSRDGELFS